MSTSPRQHPDDQQGGAQSVKPTAGSSLTGDAGSQRVSGSKIGGDLIMIGSARDVTIAARTLRPVDWPVRVGRVPALASAFQPRPGVRERVEAPHRRSGGDVVLSGGAGVGKSQLAAAYADEAVYERTDLVMWVDATAQGAVISTYAEAGALVQAPGASGRPADVEADARAFLDWIAVTDRSWLLVLDNVVDLDLVADWWPASHTRTGWVLATTRSRDVVLTGAGRTVVDVDVYDPGESQAYLTQRLTHAEKPRLLDKSAGPLAQSVGHLPLALSHAAAYMIRKKITCSDYLDLFTQAGSRLATLMPARDDTEKYGASHGRTVAVTLLLALDAADSDSRGLARPGLLFAAVLDPAGHPDALWSTSYVTTCLAEHRTRRASSGGRKRADVHAQPTVDAAQARDVLLLLDQYGLVTYDPAASPRAVRIHALTARAARETLPETDPKTTIHDRADQGPLPAPPQMSHQDLAEAFEKNLAQTKGMGLIPAWEKVTNAVYLEPLEALERQVRGQTRRAKAVAVSAVAGIALTAADAVLAVWPEADHADPGLVAVLRANTDALAVIAGDALWYSDRYAVLFRAGASLINNGQYAAAISHWQKVSEDAERLLGRDHPRALDARNSLGVSYAKAGRTEQAITLQERVVIDMERVLGPNDPGTSTARDNLGVSYAKAGRTEQAITLQERVVIDMERVLGPNDPGTSIARQNLGASYAQAGRTKEAIPLQQRSALEMEAILGPNDPRTFTAWANVANSYQAAGLFKRAIAIEERITARAEEILGADHPDTLLAYGILAHFYWRAGRTKQAIAIEERIAADMERILGADHPDTLTAHYNLAASYAQAGRTKEAIALLRQVADADARILGPDHPHTARSQASLQRLSRHRWWRGRPYVDDANRSMR